MFADLRGVEQRFPPPKKSAAFCKFGTWKLPCGRSEGESLVAFWQSLKVALVPAFNWL